MNIRGRSKYELLIVLIIIALVAILTKGFYSSRDKMNRGKMLTRELYMLRTAITLYKVKHRSNPPSLEVITEDIGEKLNRVENGVAIDPFGNPYEYDRRTSWIHSISEGYDDW